MKPVFILIRGNSASGKTVLANQLQQHFGYANCLLLHQDVIRRDILHASDHVGTPALSFIKTLIDYGFHHYPITILEGILRRDVYGDMLQSACKQFHPNSYVYYLDSSINQTIKYNQLKDHPFPLQLLQKWWLEKDYLSTTDIKLVDGSTSTFCEQIINDISSNEDS